MLYNTFWVFSLQDETKQFLSILFQDNLNIKFTMETEVNKVIPFLDLLIDNHSNILYTTTYHKLTYSSFLFNINSFTSQFYKISHVKCFVDCAYEINNTWAIFQNNFQ